MRPRFARAPARLRILLLFVLLMGSLPPPAQASHVNDLLDPSIQRFWQPPPTTSVELVDVALAAAAKALNDAADIVDERRPSLPEPQMPATFFRDNFSTNGRTGGWGSWSAETGWSVTPAAAGRSVFVPYGMGALNVNSSDRSRALAEGGYRVGSGTSYPVPMGADAIELISPEISLRSLPVSAGLANGSTPLAPSAAGITIHIGNLIIPVDSEGALDLTSLAYRGVQISPRTSCPPGVFQNLVCNPLAPLVALMNQVFTQPGRPTGDGHGELDRITLFIDHRFNLAVDTMGADGGYVSVLPRGQEEPVVVTPLRAFNWSTSSRVFTGQLPMFVEEAFDLTPWAGQDVRLLFRLNVTGSPAQARQTIFEDGGCMPMCGWDISNVRIDGPAHMTNVRLDQFDYPRPDPDPAGPNRRDGAFVARPGTDPVRLVVLNRGRVTEDVRIRMDVDGKLCDEVQVDDLRPGDTTVVEFLNRSVAGRVGCLRVQDGQTYNVDFSTTILGEGRSDSFTRDNRREIKIRGDGPDIRLVGNTLAVEDTALEPGEVARVTAWMGNYAITRGQAKLALRVDYRHPNDTDYTQTNVSWNSSLVRLPREGDVGDYFNRTISLDPYQHDNATWEFTPRRPGTYRVTLNATTPGGEELFPERSRLIGVWLVTEAIGPRSFDVAVEGVAITTTYPWDQVGFGPETNATARVSVRNVGAFRAQGAWVNVTLANDTEIWTSSTRVANLDLGTLDSTIVNASFTFPPNDGTYRFMVRTELFGEIIPGEVLLVDMVTTNNCRHILVRFQGALRTLEHLPLASCDVADAERVPVETTPRLGVDLSVQPEAGRTGVGFERELDVRLNNSGNVVVQNATLSLLVQYGGNIEYLERWSVARSPGPAEDQSWNRLRLQDLANSSREKRPLTSLTLGQDGRYFVTVFLHYEIHGETLEFSDQVRLDAFDTIFSDTFDPRGVDMDYPALVNGTDLLPKNDSWRRSAAAVPGPTGELKTERVWRFGDPETDRYPHLVDASLELPPIDLSSAQRAILAITHNYVLEEGYDGARVEASVDRGLTWIPLQPRAGYNWTADNGTVSAENPLNANQDPTIRTQAFTGNSLNRNPDRRGWVIDEFDLAQLPGFTALMQAVRFAQTGFDRAPHQGDRPPFVRETGDQRITYHTDWRLSGQSCGGLPLNPCWYRENANWENPRPLCDPRAHPTHNDVLPAELRPVCASRSADLTNPDHHYWWSGSAGDVTPPPQASTLNPGAALSVDFQIDPLTQIAPTEGARVVFWYWKDPSGTLFAGELPTHYACGHVAATPCPADPSPYRNNPAARFAEADATTGWARGEVQVTTAYDRRTTPLAVRFQYIDGIFAGGNERNEANRGAALALVALEVYNLTTGAATKSRLLLGASPTEAPTLTHLTAELRGVVKSHGSAFATGWGELWSPSACVDTGAGFYDRCYRIRWNQRSRDDFCATTAFDKLCTRNPDGTIAHVRLGWTRVAKPLDTPEAWGTSVQHTRLGEIAPVWEFGTRTRPEDPSWVNHTYPSNAHERLVTPRVNLMNVAGDFTSLTFWERFDVMEGTKRRIFVQEAFPTPEGDERLAPWVALPYAATSRRTSGGAACVEVTDDAPPWCKVRIDLSQFAGREVRFAFDVSTTRLAPLPPEENETGWFWFIDEIGIEAESMVADPVRIRFRAATDRSINEGHWMIQSLQLVGILYKHNLAVVPTEPLNDRFLAAGEEIQLGGIVRNLGVAPQGSLFLDLDVQVEEGEVPPIVRFRRNQFGAPIQGPGLPTGPVGPTALGSAGSVNQSGVQIDRMEYLIDVTIPRAASPGAVYQFRLGLVDETGKPIEDENLADHNRAFTITVRDESNYEIASLIADPPTLEQAGDQANFSLELVSTGTKSVGTHLQVVATRIDIADGAAIAVPVGASVDLPPGSRNVVTWNWTPPEAGFYRVRVDVPGTPSRTAYTHVLVGSAPRYYAENFTTDPFVRPAGEQWVRTGAPCDAMQANCWRLSEVFFDHGNRSLFIGDDAPTAIAYPTADDQARSPQINLSSLGRAPSEGENAILTGKSPFSPYLSVRYQPMLDDGDAVVVGASCDGDGCPAEYVPLRTGPSLGGRPVQGRDPWKVTSFPLFDAQNAVLNTLSGQTPLLGDHEVSFELDATWNGGDGQGFALDLVTISSYDVDVSPAKHRVDLRLGADKRFYFRVENAGAATDTYRIELARDEGNLLLDPTLATVEVLTTNLTLAPGESALVGVRVAIPLERVSTSFTGLDLVLQVISTMDPNRIATGVVEIRRFIEDDLPDLVTEVRRPQGETGPVVQGAQATFIVNVRNEGSAASRETDLVLFACPTALEIEDCGKNGSLALFETARLPALIPAKDATEGRTDHIATRTFSWVPDKTTHGNFSIVAVADPRGIVTQFDPTTSVAKLDLEVKAIERPDLQVVNLRVLDAEGRPVTRAFAGDVLRVEGTVRNAGDVTAPNVRVRIVNQFALRDERIGDLGPNASHTLSALWIARPGNWVVLFEASTPVVEHKSDNNAERWSLAIRSGTLDVHWAPEIVHMQPEGTAEVILHLNNRRDSIVELRLDIVSSDIMVKGLPMWISVPRGGSTEIPVTLAASPFAAAGHRALAVTASDNRTGAVLATATADAYVGVARSLHIVADPLLAPPGIARLRAEFQNTGQGPESFPIIATVPDGWTATALVPTLRLAPGERRSIEVLVDIPAGTPAGTYTATITAGDVVAQETVVDVTRQPAWRAEVETVHQLDGSVELLVRVENVGNTRGAPPFGMTAPAAGVYAIDPPPTSHEPGDVRLYRVTVSTTDAEAPLLHLPGRETPVPLQALDLAPPLEPLEFVRGRDGSVGVGDAVDLRLRVRASGAKALVDEPVRLWLDGELIAEELVQLAAGEIDEIAFTWQAGREGRHVLTGTVGAGENLIAKTLVVDVEPADDLRLTPGVDAIGVLAALALAMVAFGRRRSR